MEFQLIFQIKEPVAEQAAEPAGVENDAFEEAKTDEVEMSADFQFYKVHVFPEKYESLTELEYRLQ